MGIKGREFLVPKAWRAHVNPWVRDEDIADLLILRGAILWSYAHIEQVITEISIRATYREPYRGLREKPPFAMAARLAHLRMVLNAEGPLAKYRRYGFAMIARYEASRKIRNQMAHSDMFVVSVSGRQFREIVIADGEITSKTENYWSGELEQAAESAARFSRRCQRLLVAIGEQNLLPTLEDGRAMMLEEQGQVPLDKPATEPGGPDLPWSLETLDKAASPRTIFAGLPIGEALDRLRVHVLGLVGRCLGRDVDPVICRSASRRSITRVIWKRLRFCSGVRRPQCHCILNAAAPTPSTYTKAYAFGRVVI